MSGYKSGVVVKVTTVLRDVFHIDPEHILFTVNDIESRDQKISDIMQTKVKRELCDCCCDLMKPADAVSTAWNQASSVVRCHPIEKGD